MPAIAFFPLDHGGMKKGHEKGDRHLTHENRMLTVRHQGAKGPSRRKEYCRIERTNLP
jgi:hypothetical protein